MGKMSWAGAMIWASLLAGCASPPAQIKLLATMVSPIDAVAVAGGALIAYKLTEVPAWDVKLREIGGPHGRMEAQIEKVIGSTGGDGSASFAFSVAGRKWCQGKGKGAPKVISFIEYYDPHMLGAKRKARGEFECEE